MDLDDREAVGLMDHDTIGSSADTDAINTLAPPGEKLDMSHEGGEFEVFTDIANVIMRATGRHVYLLLAACVLHWTN